MISSNGEGERSGMSKGQKILKTIFLVLVWVCLGLYLEITGPTLIDLKIRTGANYEEVAVAVSGRSVGYFIGSAIGGVLVDRFIGHCDLMIGVCLTGGAIATVFVPWSPVVELLWFIIVLQGTFEGVINIAGQKLILLLWKKKAASPLHILHGGFGIGSFIIPLIANPFLAVPMPHMQGNVSTIQNFTNTTNDVTLVPEPYTYSRHSMSANDVPINESLKFDNETTMNKTFYIRESRIEFAYLISALLTLALSVVFYAYQLKGYKFSHSDHSKGDNRDRKHAFAKRCKAMVNPATCAKGRLLYGTEILSVLFIYYFNITGGERILGKFIRAYSIEQLGFSVADGSYINTTFWISFAIGRITGFVTARYIPIRILILIETGGVFVCSVLLCIFAGDNATALWVLIQPLAVFHAPCFPSGIGWGDYHVEMTGMAITFLLLGGSIGGVAYLKLTGFLFETYGPRSFLYHILGYGIACFTLAILLDIIGAQYGNRYEDEKEPEQLDQELDDFTKTEEKVQQKSLLEERAVPDERI
ncbi:sodium-dependent glucose transporter 1A-like isoform X1 [Mercenaria mercenaria]|uniref:sodium-dependent glucose transporter 1A-like isoform X1 n=1 Tax=Mercenaria mercenaria TaxID=6596 RepID=UPI00234EAB77|nr:sodium-dependent glucose transporter 1A-like isoform X1 [Mercenaria mercenaria]